MTGIVVVILRVSYSYIVYIPFPNFPVSRYLCQFIYILKVCFITRNIPYPSQKAFCDACVLASPHRPRPCRPPPCDIRDISPPETLHFSSCTNIVLFIIFFGLLPIKYIFLDEFCGVLLLINEDINQGNGRNQRSGFSRPAVVGLSDKDRTFSISYRQQIPFSSFCS